jgi:hypothetical protein
VQQKNRFSGNKPIIAKGEVGKMAKGKMDSNWIGLSNAKFLFFVILQILF